MAGMATARGGATGARAHDRILDTIDDDHRALLGQIVALTATPPARRPDVVPGLVADLRSHLAAEIGLARGLADAGLAVVLHLRTGPLGCAVDALDVVDHRSPDLSPALGALWEQLIDHVDQADHEWRLALAPVPAAQHPRFVRSYVAERRRAPRTAAGR